jgi:hypothetical protein
MKKILLACAVAASLAGCTWMHRDHGTEGSGSSVPPSYQQSQTTTPRSGADQQNAQSRAMPSAQPQDWSDCTTHPYNPSAHNCSHNQ